MRRIFKVSALFAAMWLASSPIAANASAVDDAFSGLMGAASSTTSGAGYLQTQTRGVLVGGSLRVYVPRSTVQLISISPPGFDAGCGGINLFLGGFSFINAAQFQQLVKNIMTNALGYAIELGIRTLCPMCADILNALQKLAQSANNMGLNSCYVAQNLVNLGANALAGKSWDFSAPNGMSSGSQSTSQSDGTSGGGSGSQAAQGLCSNIDASSGGSTDFLSAMSDACNSLASSMNKISGWLSSPPPGSNKQSIAAQTQAVQGNQLWMSLTEAGYAQTDVKEALMALNGFSVTPTTGGSAGKPIVVSGWGPNGGDIMMVTLLFGNNPTTSFNNFKSTYGGQIPPDAIAQLQEAVNNIASQNGSAYSVPVCCGNTGGLGGISGSCSAGGMAPPVTALSGSGTSDVLQMCTQFDMVPLGSLTAAQNNLLAGNGLFFNVYHSLNEAVTAVTNGTAIPKDAIQIMQLSPLPVYRMVNIAAVYPQAAAQLVQRYSYFISVLIAESIIDNMISPDKQMAGVSEVPMSTITGMQNMLSSIGMQIKTAQGSIGDALAVQESMMANLHSINQIMYQQMAATGLQGNLLFSQSISTTGR